MSHFTLDDGTEAEPITFDFKGETFSIAEVPARFWLRGMKGEMEEALTELLGDDAERFWALRPSMRQVESLTEHLAREVGADLGKSGVPSPSSNGTPTVSTPTSAATGG
jgi:hypothetical protein